MAEADLLQEVRAHPTSISFVGNHKTHAQIKQHSMYFNSIAYLVLLDVESNCPSGAATFGLQQTRIDAYAHIYFSIVCFLGKILPFKIIAGRLF